jgi:hypothetical protein
VTLPLCPHPAFPLVALADIFAELHRERSARAKLYPKRVAEGRISQAEADFGLAVVDALILDCDRIAWPRRNRAETHKVTWGERRAALAAELAQRRRLYPEWIAAGRFGAGEGERRIARLTALLWVYEDGFDWRAANGARPAFAKWQDRTPAENAARAEWCALEYAIHQARHPPRQEEMSL